MPTAILNRSESVPADLRQCLRDRLLRLTYPAFLKCVIHLLQTQGYRAVRPAGRDHWKGRNRAGGWDAEAELRAGALGSVHCLIQVKQFDTLAVHLRSVDELRGSCLRAGAGQALLVTLSTFSQVARQAAKAETSVAPIRLIDGDGLLDLLIASRIGICRSPEGTWQLYGTYFDMLSQNLDGTSAKPGTRSAGHLVRRQVTETVPTPSVTIMLMLRCSSGKGKNCSKRPRS